MARRALAKTEQKQPGKRRHNNSEEFLCITKRGAKNLASTPRRSYKSRNQSAVKAWDATAFKPKDNSHAALRFADQSLLTLAAISKMAMRQQPFMSLHSLTNKGQEAWKEILSWGMPLRKEIACEQSSEANANIVIPPASEAHTNTASQAIRSNPENSSTEDTSTAQRADCSTALIAATQAATATTVNGPKVDLDQTFLLESKPNASKTIFLDFDGRSIAGTAWDQGNLSNGLAPAFTLDDDASSNFSEGRRHCLCRRI